MGNFGTRNVGDTIHIYNKNTHEILSPYSPIVYTDDFLGSDVVIPAAASPESGCKWVKKIVGAAPPTVAIKADEVNGLVECALTSTSEKQNAEAYFNDELQFSILQGAVLEARFALSVLPTLAAEFVVGFTSAWADGLDSATYSAFFTCDGGGLITCESDDNATDGSTSSGVTLVASEYATVRLDCTAAATAGIKFYVNGALVVTSAAWAASAANSKVQPIFGLYKASGAGVGTALVDYVKITQNRS
jgi:hypothetical protein